MTLLVALFCSLAMASPPEAYVTAVRLVDRLYLQRDRVDEAMLLRQAVRRAESELHWLMVAGSGASIELHHGNGTRLGRVTVADMDDLPRALGDVEALIRSGGPLRDVDVRRTLLAGLADALDRYSRLLADDGLERFNVRLTGTQVGIGAGLTLRDHRLWVHSVHEGGPAAQAGLQPGDELLRIDGRSSAFMPLSEARRLLRGEVGTQVVLRASRAGKVLRLVLTRADVVVPNVTHRLLDGSVGYVHIDHISQRTVENLRRSLTALAKDGGIEHGLVLDLRGNTGGSMKEAARLADQFLEEGLLLRTAGRDGGRVQNLESEMVASAQEGDLAVPLVVLVNHRTASGSEILVGSLLEHHRAGVVGTRTYGKGTVQKSYPLQRGVSLKLTVARYILANERRITELGLLPDVPIGSIRLDGAGAHYRGWGQRSLADSWERILPAVTERPGWRGQQSEGDLALELARRAVLDAADGQRETIVAALQRHAARLRVEQEATLADALQARGVDWSEAPHDSVLDADVALTAEPIGGDSYRLVAAVTNRGRHAVHRGAVQLVCRTLGYWDGLVIPVGRVPAGQTRSGEIRLNLRPGIRRRVDEVDVTLRADGAAAMRAASQLITTQTRELPTVRVDARLVPRRGQPLGPHGHPVHEVRVSVRNLSSESLTGLEVHFGYPEDRHIELMDHGARLRVVAPRSTAEVALAVELAPGAPLVLPLDLVVESDAFGRLARWPLALPTTGDPVRLQAPRIEVRADDAVASVGSYALPLSVADDGQLDHVVVWANGAKVAWRAGSGGRMQLQPEVVLRPGANTLEVHSVDEQGIASRSRIQVWGLLASGQGAASAEE
ncbi:MAG: PDZ domain-containing protein [Myxococcales bacterium]|nr:PDZ domain-containing protein [Myxococcales bacterium]